MQARTRRTRRLLGGGIAIVMAIGLGAFHTGAALAAPSSNCTDQLLNAERTLDIPRGLLLSIALVESGQDGAPQSYAVGVRGRSIYSANAARASSYLRDRRGNVRTNVTAGCMQLSVTHHRENFRPLERILDPEANVMYAARFLKRLRAEEGNWGRAVARYQGGTHTQQRDYVCKVWQRLTELDGKSAELMPVGARCNRGEAVAIAPETRRAFHQSQVAQLPE